MPLVERNQTDKGIILYSSCLLRIQILKLIILIYCQLMLFFFTSYCFIAIDFVYNS